MGTPHKPRSLPATLLEENMDRDKRYNQSDAGKARAKRYNQSKKGKARAKRAQEKRRKQI